MKVYPHHERCPPALVASDFYGARLLHADGWDEYRASVHCQWPLSPTWWAETGLWGLEEGEAATEGPTGPSVDSKAHSARQGG